MLPGLLLSRLRSFLSVADYNTVLAGFSFERVTSFRTNTLKSTDKEIEDFLRTNTIEFTKVSWLPNAFIIDKKDEYWLKGSDIYYSGKIYVQGLASQIPPHFLGIDPSLRAQRGNPKECHSSESQNLPLDFLNKINRKILDQAQDDRANNKKILDVTAAPGSKTSQIAALLENTGEVVACEKHQIRFDKLVHNLKLQGCTNVETHKMEAEKLNTKYKNGFFDAILLDAPCSAEGRIYEPNEKSYGFWTLENITRNSTAQWDLIETTLPLLGKGGTFVYSTCTLAPEENEAHIARILKRFPGDFRLEKVWVDSPFAREGIIEFEGKNYGEEMKNTLRILPSKENEGFFVAKLRRV